jgi:hypothetical protein
LCILAIASFFTSKDTIAGVPFDSVRRFRSTLLHPVPWKMGLEMVIGMQIEILNGIKKLPFYGSFQIFM